MQCDGLIYRQLVAVAFAENFHGGFIQWHMVAFAFGVRCL